MFDEAIDKLEENINLLDELNDTLEGFANTFKSLFERLKPN